MYNRIEVFYAYAPQDEEWVQELEKHLSVLQRQGFISTWHPRLITAGEDWQHVIDVRFRDASIILLLISPDFLASDYCYGAEMKQALEQEQGKGVCVIPILLRPADWRHAPFAHLSPLPSDATFLTEAANLDRAFTEVAAGIRRAIENLSLLAASLARTDFPRMWNVPFPRNLFFIGREELLARLHSQLQEGRTAALSQALSGLGGIGKTQLAVEYAYRFYRDYQAVLWAHAESSEVLVSSYTEIAGLLNLPVKNSQEQAVIVQAVKIWLQNHQNWLLILDNADELSILPAFLPPRLGGHLIITTRAAAPGRLARRLLVETFSQEQGVLFLLRRAGLIALDAEVSQALPQDQELAKQITQEVDGLPLALDQIGAYLETTGSGLAAYWQQYQQHRIELLKDYRGTAVDHPEPVATTWSLSFQRVEERNPAAADLLRLCAFLAPDAIWEEMLRQGADTLSPKLSAVVADGYLLDLAIETLRAYSLIARDVQAKALAMHRLVQTVLRDALPTEEQKQWMLQVVALVNQAFPDVEFENWPQCERYLPHALISAQWIKQGRIVTPAAMRLLDHLGYYLTVRGQYREAEPLLEQALSLREEQLGPEHPDTALSLHNLAFLSRLRGKYIEAEPLYQRALSIRSQQLGPEHLDTAISLHGLGSLYLSQGKYTEAESFYQRVLSIREQQLGSEHPKVATSLNSLARVYERWGRYTQAESLVVRSLSIFERQLGSEHPETSDCVHNLALLYRRQGKYAQAEPLALRALAVREQQLGPEHPDTVNALSNLVRLYTSQGKYMQVKPLALRELATREQLLGNEHPAIAFSLANIARLYVVLKKYTEAEPLALRALAIREQQLGPEHFYTVLSLDDLAYLYTSQGKYVQAEPLYQRALTICEQQLGPEHPHTALILHDLAYLYASQGKHTEAEPLHLRALAIREQQLGPEHPDTATSLYNLAHLYVSQEKYTEAEPLYQRSLAIRVQQLGPEHPDTLVTQESYASLLQQKRKF
jgi:tetratricopeptide (TPR) repeat protein